MESRIQRIKTKLGEWAGFVALICLAGYILIHSTNSIIKLCLIQSNGATILSDHTKTRHAFTGKSSTEYLHFRFDVDEISYELDRGDDWWYSTSDISNHEKFEISYWSFDPSVCLPSKYIFSTWRMNIFLFLFSFFLIFIGWSLRPWVSGRQKKMRL